jgi:hypothetical protein
MLNAPASSNSNQVETIPKHIHQQWEALVPSTRGVDH